jgi:hypothetical protein
MLQVTKTYNDEELSSSSSCIFCSNVVGPKDTTTRNSAPHCCIFFLQMLQVPGAMTTRSSALSHRAFFCSNVVGLRNTMKNLAPCHRVWRSPWQ